ncbi:MAG: hypothetical protein DHS20C14_19860 [Phycisphaeraceae bacterium]|nr:MAG: hypothetical protein DHS20C14_19860 [Phycisphaeraceae bacterium]
MPEPHDHLAARIDRVEEGHAFADRRSDQLGEEIAELNRRVHEAVRRLERLENLLDKVTRNVEAMADHGTQAPPHAAGPDVPRDPL